MTSHYDTLGVASTASAVEIRDVYRRLARQHHPDRSAGRDATAMAVINEAYRVLSDTGRRTTYDAQLGGRSTTLTAAASAAERVVTGPAADLPPARFPWKLAVVMATVGATVVLIGAAFYQPGTEQPPDNVLRPGSCVMIEANNDAREINCTGSADELVVASIVAVDERCPEGLAAYRDRQGLGMACVRAPG